MFANHTSEGGTAIFDDMSQDLSADNTMSIFVSSDGSAGPKVSINKALLLSALSIDPQAANIGTGISYDEGKKYDASGVTFASETYADAMRLEDVSVGVFTKALENLATLRADNGGTM